MTTPPNPATTLDALRGTPRIRFIIVFLFVTQAAFAFGGWQHMQTVNDTVYWADQGEYYRYSARVVFTDGAYAGDFNRAPLFNWVQALHYQPGEHPQDFHARSLYVSVALALASLVFIFFVFLRYMRLSLAVLGYMVIAFMFYLFKAPYLQAEVAYYTASFAAFVLMVEMLLRPSWWGAGLLGFTAGVAQLSKSSMLAGLFAFAVVYGLGVVWRYRVRSGGRAVVRPDHKPAPHPVGASDGASERDETDPLAFIPPRSRGLQSSVTARHGASAVLQCGEKISPKNCLLMLVLALATFALTILPDALTARAVDGPLLYNVNTSLYIWVDDWEQVKDGIQMERPQNAYPHHLPDDELPSLHNYLARNGVQGLLTQTWEGLQFQVLNHLQTGYGYQHYVLLLGAALVLFPAWAWRQHADWLRARLATVWPVVLFAALFFVGYGLLYSFYVPINPGKRFWQALILPFVWLALWALDHPRWWEMCVRGRPALAMGVGVLLVLVTLHAVVQMTVNIRAFSGG